MLFLTISCQSINTPYDNTHICLNTSHTPKLGLILSLYFVYDYVAPIGTYYKTQHAHTFHAFLSFATDIYTSTQHVFVTNIDMLSTLLAPNHVLIIIFMAITYGKVFVVAVTV
jgi:hypothetical protein